ncbi:MAG: class I SAM-dependent methyltransferase [Candidatus Hydrogenedentes bacterium]|nr:class I SAM-dependent methyltransferase [Candidatus Hydrogenedentota bacterium]
MSYKDHNSEIYPDNLPNEWYKEAFSIWYKVVYSHRNVKEAQKQVKFLASLIPISLSTKILDLCCGYGRHIRFLSKLSNFVVGVDLSSELLTQARAQNENLAEFICADVRSLPFHENSFDIVLSLFTSFGYFYTDEENYNHLKNLASVLKCKGYFVLDYFNPNKVKLSKKHSSTKKVNDLIIREVKWLDDKNNRINKNVTIEDIKGNILKSYIETVKIYEFSQIEEMLIKCGIIVQDVYGDYSGSEFTNKSPRLIIIARKYA